MATDAQRFFETERPAAVLKHGLLSRYLPIFVRMTGSRAPDKRVAYLDGYAGPGHYDDDAPGSPALAIETAQTVLTANGEQRIDGYFVERDRENYKALRAFFDERAIDWPVYHGGLEEHLPGIVAAINPEEPLFAFLDPFGLCIPLDMINAQLLSRSGQVRFGYRTEGAATEVLLNFSFAGLRRRAGHLTSPSQDPTYLKARATMLDRMDRTLGGDWWREIWIGGDPNREERIREEYCRRVGELDGNWSVYSVPVANAIDGRPAYSLLLMTQHPEGLWKFNEVVSNALEEWRAACIAEVEAEGKLVLIEPEADRQHRLIEEIKGNVRARVDEGAFVIRREMGRVYGGALGFAREKHIRKAVKELYAEGVVNETGKGDVPTMRLTPKR